MDERLVPLRIIESPSLTSGQQQEMTNKSIAYLKSLKIPLRDSAVLRQGLSVMRDALARGLQSQGRPHVDEEETLQPLIKEGLLLRDSLRHKTVRAYELTVKNPTTDKKLTGPLALPNSLIEDICVMLPKFATTGDLERCERLVNAAQIRLPIARTLAADSLTHLPHGLSRISINQFTKPADWSKLIRNTILSAVFKGELTPLVSSADLIQFSRMSRQNSFYFNSEMMAKVIEAIAGNQEGARIFVADLFRQSAVAITENTVESTTTDPREIDRFYYHISRDFLFLHPILEPGLIQTRPDSVGGGVHHLWEEAYVLKDMRIPQKYALLLALKQAGMRRDHKENNRLSGGIRLWERYRRESETYTRKIEDLKSDIQRREDLLREIESNGPLPPSAYFIRFVDQYAASRNLRGKQAWEKAMKRRIEESSKVKQEAKEYEDKLTKEYGDNWPDRVVIPRRIYLERALDRRDRLTALLSQKDLPDQKKEIVRLRLDRVRVMLGHLYEHPRLEVPKNIKWNKVEAQLYLQEMKLSVLPEISQDRLQALRKPVADLRSLLSTIGLSFLPAVFPLNELEPFLSQRAAKIRTRLSSGRPPDESTDRQLLIRDLAGISQLKRFLKTPILDFGTVGDQVSLTSDVFNRIITRRVGQAQALLSYQEADTGLQAAKAYYESVMRTTFIQVLNWELTAKTSYLKSLQNRDLDGEFIDEMRKLNLVLADP